MFRFLFAIMALFVTAPALAVDTITLTETNTIALTSEVDPDSVARLMDQIQRSDAKELVFYIDSPGGSVIDGLQLIDVMKASGKRFVCVANSAASMAFSIFQQCDKRLITSHAILMQHMGSYGLQGPAPHNATLAKMAEKLFAELVAMDAARLGITPEQLYAKTRDDYWLFAKDAIKDKAADGMVGVKCDKAMADKKTKQTLYTFFGAFEVTTSGCPIIVTPLEIKPVGQIKGTSDEVVKVIQEFIEAVRPRHFFEERMEGSTKKSRR